jgi:hypothetical protein
MHYFKSFVLVTAFVGLLGAGTPAARAETLVVPPAPSPIGPLFRAQNLIQDGGFENNAGTPWWLSGSNATIDKLPHCGALSLRLGGYGNGSAFYRLTIPATAARADLSFYLQVQSNDLASADRNTWAAGDHLEMEVVTNGFHYTERWWARQAALTRGVWSYEYIWNLQNYKGQVVDLSFKAFADGVNATWFFIDDVALWTGYVLTPVLGAC